MKVLMVSGSRNRQGQTARAADAVLEGATGAGAQVERVFLPELAVERCRQCDESGWGLCSREGRCVIEDDLAMLTDKLRGSGALLFATPVYFSDLSESMRAFCDRLRRTCRCGPGESGIEGKPVIGLCVAGGGGGGAPSCCVSLEKVLTTCQLDAVDMIPVRRQNLEAKLEGLKLAGAWLATGPSSQ